MSRLSGVLPLCAWLACLVLFVVAPSLRGLLDPQAQLPIVSIEDSSGGDVTSNVGGLVVVAAWALLAALLVEPAKAVSVKRPHGAMLYFWLLMYQVILVADTIRAHTSDWWTWLLSLAGIGQLKDVNDVNSLAGSVFPWISFLAAVALLAFSFRKPNEAAPQTDEM